MSCYILVMLFFEALKIPTALVPFSHVARMKVKVVVASNGFPFRGQRGAPEYVSWLPDDATAATAEGNNGESVFKTLQREEEEETTLRFLRRGRMPDAELPHASDSC